MDTVDYRDALVRAAKTFVQVAVPMLAGIPALVAAGTFSAIPAILGGAALAGAAAVVALVWNVALDWSRS